MKNIKLIHSLYFFLLTISFGLISCEKEIELDVPQATPKIVVEAIVSDKENASYIRITRSKSIYDNESSAFDIVTDAVVTISDNEDNTYSFDLAVGTAGYYLNSDFIGEIGKTYTLDIIADETHITAEETMLSSIILEEVTFQDIPIGENNDKQVICHYQDNALTEDYYLFSITATGTDTVFAHSYKTVRSDLLFNGQLTETVMDRYRAEQGANLEIQLWHINKENYKYFYTLGSIEFINQGGPFGDGTPGNPISTINGDAIGFFSAVSMSTLTIVVP